jgi:hypothetical protein
VHEDHHAAYKFHFQGGRRYLQAELVPDVVVVVPEEPEEEVREERDVHAALL